MKNSIRVFQYFHIRVPKERIESGHTEQGLLLNILQDLWKCPKILFDQLHTEDRNQFLSTETNEDEELPALIRYEDDFHLLVQRFIDYTESLKDFRFAIQIAPFYHKVYTKSIGGQDHIRRLAKKLYVGKRIQELNENEYPPEWKELLKDTADLEIDYSLPYIRRQLPQHLSWSNNILLFEKKSSFPHLSKNNDGSYDVSRMKGADYVLSNSNLSALCFYLLIGGNTDQLEGIIKGYKQNIISFIENAEVLFEESIPNPDSPYCSKEKVQKYKGIKTQRIEELKAKLASNQHINLQDIPHSILHYILNIEDGDPTKAALASVNKLMEQVKKQINRFKTNYKFAQEDKKIGVRRNKAGKLASIIVEKLLYYQDKNPASEHGSKATGMQYALLQSRFAFFGRDKALIPDLLRELKLIESDIAHPFISRLNILKYNDIASFFEAFLKSEKDYLLEIREAAKTKDISQYHFIKIRKAQDTIQKSIQNLIQTKPYPIGKTVVLRLCKKEVIDQFVRKKQVDTSITEIKNKIDHAINDIESNESCSLTLLVKHYFDIFFNDRAQDWYDMKRHYPFIDKEEDNRQGRDKFKPIVQKFWDSTKIRDYLYEVKHSGKYSEQKELANQFQDLLQKQAARKWINQFKQAYQNEGKLDQFQMQDILRYMMSRKLINKIYEVVNLHEINKLQDISFDKNISLINQEQIIRINIPSKEGKQKQVETSLNLKKIGNLEWLIKDRRMQNLPEYYDESIIDYEIIRKEIEKYQILRADAFIKPLAFEKLMRSKKAIIGTLSFRELAMDFYHNIYPDYIQEVEINEMQIDLAVTIRNALAHNQYPEASKIPNKVLVSNSKKMIIEILIDSMNEEIEKWIKVLNKYKTI